MTVHRIRKVPNDALKVSEEKYEQLSDQIAAALEAGGSVAAELQAAYPAVMR